MLLKESWLYVSDNTNVCWVKIFHLYKGFFRKNTKPKFFVKATSRVVEPPRLEYKGFKYKYSVKGDIVKLWFVRSIYYTLDLDKSYLNFKNNSGIIIFKKQNIKSKFVNGPIPRSLKIKKLQSIFKTSL